MWESLGHQRAAVGTHIVKPTVLRKASIVPPGLNLGMVLVPHCLLPVCTAVSGPSMSNGWDLDLKTYLSPIVLYIYV